MASVAESPNRLFWLIVLAIFFPFLSVGIEFGFCSQEFWINLVLSLLIPFCGFIHAVYVLVHARYSRAPSRSGYEPVGDVDTDAERAHPQRAPATSPATPLVPKPVVRDAKSPAGPGAPAGPSNAVPPSASKAQAPAASASRADPAHNATEPPPYTPGTAVSFDNKIQRS